MATVLVVDDRPPNRELVRAVLGYQGHQVLEAVDGDEALDRIRTTTPDLVITDILMPGMDGCELVRELRANPRTVGIPVVFYTANYLEHEVGPIAKAFGVARVLTKGHGPEELLDTVEEILAGRMSVEPGSPSDDVIREHLRTVNAKLIEKVREMERKEDELRRSEEQFRRMAESAPVGIALGDADGNAWYVNTRLVEILACGADNLLGAGWRQRIALRDRYLSGGADGRPVRVRRKYTDDSGTTKWLSVTVSLAMGDDGVPFGTVSAVDDITAVVDAEARQRELDGRIRVSERLESLGRLAGGVAHDFNNILTAILAYTQFAQDANVSGMKQGKVDDAVGTVTVGHLDKVLAAADRAANLTAQLLTFGRPDIARPEVLDVNLVVAEVVNLLARTIGEHIEMTADYREGLWPVRIDASQLSQVVLNLAVNARDAMHAGGSLTIRTRNVTTDAAPPEATEPRHTVDNPPAELPAGRYIQLSVADTGHGMPPNVLARAFEPFFTTKTAGEGTGLGLATVHSIIRQAGGRIAIETAPGLGTTINAYLPASDEESTVNTAEAPEDHAGGNETILVVDDEETVCDIAEQILQAAGYQTLTAASGADAVELATAHPHSIDLLLTDVVMPRMSGSELANTMASRYPDTKVLFMSGYADALLNDQGALAANVAILSKPFSAAALLRAVRIALDTEPRPRLTAGISRQGSSQPH